MTFNREYIEWNYRRIKKIIDFFGHPAFADKTILDLGCGHGDVGAAIARLGGRVIAVDARQNHLDVAKKKYPHITTICADLDKNWPFANQKFDFVLNLGLLCHLTNYAQILQKTCQIANNLILETEVCDSDDPTRVVQIDEHRSIYDWAFNGVGHKPSAANIEKILQEAGMKFQRFDTPDLNTGPYRYDWELTNTHSRKIGNRRFWIAKKDPSIVSVAAPIITPPNKVIRLANSATAIKPELVYKSKNISSKKEGFRTAVCISGYLRSFEQTFERLNNNLLKKTNADVFIHTWDFLGSPLRGFDAKLNRISTRTVLERIEKLYNPIRIVVEPAINFPIPVLMHQKNLDGRDINGLLSMFYKMQVCNQLKKDYEKENNFIYDCVVRTRSDLLFMSPFYIDDKMDTNKLYIPHGYDYEGINDQLAYGGSSVMDKFCSIYSNIEKLLMSGEKLNPERLVRSHIIQNDLPLERCHMHYYIKRAV